jgi:hypothetical protein
MLRDYFKTTKYLFKNDSQVRSLSGKEEGINAWIAANYFAGNFKVLLIIKISKGVLFLRLII